MPEYIQVDAIRTDGGTQARAGMDGGTVYEYAESMKNGAQFPAVTVYYDGSDYWLADGFHRIAAAKECGLDEFEADVKQGTLRDAILHSVGANSTHGLRRSRQDKRRAIERLLLDDEWVNWSDREIARRTGTSHPMVANVRDSLERTGKITSVDNRRTADGRMMDTQKIGKPSDNHWAAGFGEKYFWDAVRQFNLDKDKILNQVQPGAKRVTDLKINSSETFHLLARIATERNRTEYPVDSYVKHVSGAYGIVKRHSQNGVIALRLDTGSEVLMREDDIVRSTRESWERSVEQQQPKPEPPAIQIGDTVRTRTGRVDTVRDVQARLVYLDNDSRPHYIESLAKVQAQPPAADVLKTWVCPNCGQTLFWDENPPVTCEFCNDMTTFKQVERPITSADEAKNTFLWIAAYANGEIGVNLDDMVTAIDEIDYWLQGIRQIAMSEKDAVKVS